MQAEDIVAALKVFSATIAPVVLERGAITAALAVQLAGGQPVLSPPLQIATAVLAEQGPHPDEWDTGYTSLHALSAALKRNIMREHAAHMTLSDFMSFNVLTKMQLARISASSYPYIPDALGIMLCDSGRVLVEAGVPAATVAAVLKDM